MNLEYGAQFKLQLQGKSADSETDQYLVHAKCPTLQDNSLISEENEVERTTAETHAPCPPLMGTFQPPNLRCNSGGEGMPSLPSPQTRLSLPGPAQPHTPFKA